MPISSERMLSLISAAKAFRQSRADLIMTIRAEINSLPPSPSPSDFQTVVGNIQLILSTFPFPTSAAETIATEETHFKEVKGRNERAKRYQRRKRAGIESDLSPSPHSTAPAKISPLPPLAPSPPSPKISPIKPLSAPTDEVLLSLGISEMALAKITANEEALAAGLPEPYPDPTDDEQPLREAHE